jgi:hypothetical protein
LMQLYLIRSRSTAGSVSCANRPMGKHIGLAS